MTPQGLQRAPRMAERDAGRGFRLGEDAVSVALELPAEWAGAVGRVIIALADEFDCQAMRSVTPHISLRQSFLPSVGLELVESAVAKALAGAPVLPVSVGPVASFDRAPGDPSVIYLAAASKWLDYAHLRLLDLTGPLRARPRSPLLAPGNPAFDLSGFTPHITLAMDDLPAAVDTRKSMLVRAAELWQSHAPASPSFLPERVTLSVWSPREKAGAAGRQPAQTAVRSWSLPLAVS